MEKLVVFAYSCIGESHQKNGTVLQDGSDFYEDEKCRIIVVSDGHGSKNFVRSDRGSKIACKVAIDATREFIEQIEVNKLKSNFTNRDQIVDQLCKNILSRWVKEVNDDYQKDPFTEEEVKNVKEKYRIAYLKGENIEHAYGATLQLAFITANYFLAIRNGDGECVVINSNGEFLTPVPENEKCEASFTTSLCDENAIEDFRYFYSGDKICSVFLGSDGIDNSYVTKKDLFTLYRNICRKVAYDGIEKTKSEIERILPIITKRGSGDDVSIAGIIDTNILKNTIKILDKKVEQQSETRRTEKDINDDIDSVTKKIAEVD